MVGDLAITQKCFLDEMGDVSKTGGMKMCQVNHLIMLLHGRTLRCFTPHTNTYTLLQYMSVR